MALRTKTVEFAFDTRVTTLAPTVRHDFSSITLYSPENTSRTFRSAIIEINVRDNEAASGAFVTSFLIGIKLAAVAFNDATVTGTISQFTSNAAKSFVLTRDVTSYFNTNFGSGTSQTSQVGVVFGGIDTINITAKLILTYEYDDSGQTTQIKTVRVPLDGSTGNLTNTLTELGTNQIPALDTFLPEASKTYRQIWFEVCANEADPNTTDFSWGLQLDSATEFNDGLHEAALSSAPFSRILWNQNSMTTNVVHAFKVRGTVTNRFNITNVTMFVTYEYNESTSTTIMNSLMLPLKCESNVMGFSSSTNLSRLQTVLLVSETAPTLVQSGVYIGWTINSDNGTFASLNLKVGSQASFRSYTPSFTTFEGNQGMWMMSQRFDSGSAGGSGLSLARGYNTINVDCYTGSTQTKPSLVSGFLILNYTSDKHGSGSGVHNHTTFWNLTSTVFTGANPYSTDATSSSVAPVIPETNFYASNISIYENAASAPSRLTMGVIGEIQSGEGIGDGWKTITIAAMSGGGMVQTWFLIAEGTDSYTRFPGDQGPGRLDLETARVYRAVVNNECYCGYYMLITYHAITYVATGAVSGYTGNGSGVAVKFYRADTKEYVLSTTTAIGGGFSFTWYDNTVNMFAEAKQDSSHRGRSDDVVAV